MAGGLFRRLQVEGRPEGVVLRFGGGGGVFSFSLSTAEVDDLINELSGYGTPDRPVADTTMLDQRKVRRRTGAEAVALLIDEGLISPGEELTMRTGGRTHRAQVLEDGSFSVAGRVERSPTEAACAVAKSRRSGWRMWTAASGETLEELRWKCRARMFSQGDEGEILEAWVADTVSRRFSPGRDHPNIFDSFCRDNGIDPDQAQRVLAKWFDWCSDNKWTRPK